MYDLHIMLIFRKVILIFRKVKVLIIPRKEILIFRKVKVFQSRQIYFLDSFDHHHANSVTSQC